MWVSHGIDFGDASYDDKVKVMVTTIVGRKVSKSLGG